MAKWYKKKRLQTYTATYKNEKELNREANAAAKYGWRPQGAANAAGSHHINVGRTMAKIMLLGVPFLVTGVSRSKGKLVVTYERM